MGLLEFNKLPINTLVGADWKTFKALTDGREVDAAWRGKYRLTKAVCRLLSTLAPIQERRYQKRLADKPLEHAPVFILGHWRSGTTFVHNVLSCDKHFGYNTTYQTVFPHLMMFGQPFFKKNMSWLMPDKRPTDNMELAVDLPQEEEFALANMCPYTYYNFWFFPKYQLEYCDKYMLFNDITPEELKVWRELEGKDAVEPPKTTMSGALSRYITLHAKNFQPMNSNFGILPAIECRDKKERRKAYVARAEEDMKTWIETILR